MAKPKWTPEDNSKACATQGWAIFDEHQLCRDDEQGAFEDDNAAMRFVGVMAQPDPETGKPGNKLAAKVLRFLEVVNPEQFRTIKQLAAES